MKNIIVPTDFSKNANNALQYAIHIANHFECNIHLIHAYIAYGREDTFVKVKSIAHKEIEMKLSEMIKENKAKLFKRTTLYSKAIEGFPRDVIGAYAKAIDADLIVMGTQGTSSIKGIFLGTNTSVLVNKTDLPVLAIPSEVQYKKINNIVLAVDHLTITSAEVFKPLLKLNKPYQAKVQVLHVESNKRVPIIDPGIDVYLSETEHTFHKVKEENVSYGISRFINLANPELLCMIHRKREGISNLFHSSVVSKKVFDSPVPILILHDNY